MLLRALNRRRWIATVPAFVACYAMPWKTALAEPPVAARVISLTPISSDHPVPVVTALALDPTGQWLAVAGDDKAIRILQADTFAELAVLQGHRDIIRAVDFRPDNKVLASTGNDGSLILWERANQYRELRRVDRLPAVCSAKFSPDGKQLAAVGFSSQVMMFGGTLNRAEMACACNDLRVCAFNRRGNQLAIAGRSGHVHLFDPVTGKALQDFDLQVGRIRDCEFTSDGNRLITVGEDGVAVLFDLQRGEELRRIDLLPCKLFTLAQIDDRHVAVAGSDNRIRVVNFDSGVVVTHLDGHRGSISKLVYANGSLYSGGFDATLRRWPLAGDGGERVAEKESPVLPIKDSASR